MNAPNYTPPIQVAHRVTTPSGGEDVVATLEDVIKILCEDTGYEVELVHSTAIVYEIRLVRRLKLNAPPGGIVLGCFADVCTRGTVIGRYQTAREAENALGAELGDASERCAPGYASAIHDYSLAQVEVFTDGHNTPVPHSDCTAVKVNVSKILTRDQLPQIEWNPKG